jgi:hypothetical protein
MWNDMKNNVYTHNLILSDLKPNHQIRNLQFQNESYFCQMINLRFLLLFSLLHLAIFVPAQNFKVIKETDDYILKECDSVFYYSHGIEPKDDFVLDTTKIHKVNGVLKLPLDNGKKVELKDSLSIQYWQEKVYKSKNYYFVNEGAYFINTKRYLVDKKNCNIEYVENIPIISPNSKYYGYCFINTNSAVSGVIFKNLLTNEITIDSLGYMVAMEVNPSPIFKWINDNSFMYYTYWAKDIKFEFLPRKYYLVEIKK